jgi:hypothetical protein
MTRARFVFRMFFGLLPVTALVLCGPTAFGQQAAVFQVEYTNAQLVPAHWKLTLHEDGSGQFDAEGGQPSALEATQILSGDVHRPVQLSPAFTAEVFSLARQRKLFDYPCESHMKVAFQGTKKLSYSGPEGSGSCEFNYSKDKDIEALGNSLLSVETTILSGARMEKLLLHDRLGLDQELNYLTGEVHNGDAIEIGVIRETLTRIASDDQVMERAQRKARLLLAQAH